MDTTGDTTADGLKAPTKSRVDENFPVASWLIPARLRRHVHVFYLCVRAADDVADDGARAPQEKTALLSEMDAALQGKAPRKPATAPAHDLAASLRESGVSAQHARELLQAFQMDVTKLRYRNWSELLNYCRYSAAPVGRYLLDLHGEDKSIWPATDALCAALQILNHLQDCKDDYLALDRVYIPEPWLREEGIGVEVLKQDAAGPELRRVLDRTLARTDELIIRARAAPRRIRSLGLRLETAFIIAIAARLSARLKRRDPVAGRVKLGAADYALCAVQGLTRGLLRI
jgi:farnesyl-diphosphate farnesyltransferase